jgi:zinc D-Ala-D-Ala carboxypeptidase
MTQNFTLAEFVSSDTAARRNIDNRLPGALEPAALSTLEMMERIRAHLSAVSGRDIPIRVTSGYRSPALNMAIGGSSSSDHTRAQAVDWRAPAFGTPLECCLALAPHVSTLGIGQLIHEFGSWVHTSTAIPAKPLNRIITIAHRGVTVGIVEA